MVFVIINGPNLNLIGTRQPEIYGTMTFEEYIPFLREKFENHMFIYLQSNHEGKIIDWLHEFGFSADGIVLNAGGYTHTSISIADAVKSIKTPVVEVHISNIKEREIFRHHSYLEAVCIKSIMGEGLKGYELAIDFMLNF